MVSCQALRQRRSSIFYLCVVNWSRHRERGAWAGAAPAVAPAVPSRDVSAVPLLCAALHSSHPAHSPTAGPQARAALCTTAAGTYYGGRQVRDKVKQYLETDTGIPHGARANTPPARRLEVRPSAPLRLGGVNRRDGPADLRFAAWRRHAGGCHAWLYLPAFPLAASAHC